MTIFSLLIYFTEAPTSPFFVYFVFSLVSALLRWQWRGVVWTAVIALALFICMGAYVAEILHNAAFELNHLIIRSMFLLVVAMLLAYLGVYEQGLQQAAAAEERIRLARDLHDGVLQFLAGAALQVETVCRLFDKDSRAARERLLDLQRQLAAEQHDLRFFIQELKPTLLSPPETDFQLVTHLEELGVRIERQWDLSVTMHPAAQILVPVSLTRDLYQIVHEALINVARHAHATTAHVTLGVDDTQIRLTVADNGRGFPFHGR
jgi:signal transduction histidine kinase